MDRGDMDRARDRKLSSEHVPCSLPALCPSDSTFLGGAVWTKDEHLAQRWPSVAVARVQKYTTESPGETSQNTRCPIQHRMEILTYSVLMSSQEVHSEKAVQLILMCFHGKGPLYTGGFAQKRFPGQDSD